MVTKNIDKDVRLICRVIFDANMRCSHKISTKPAYFDVDMKCWHKRVAKMFTHATGHRQTLTDADSHQLGGTALHSASLTNNVEGARILCEAKIDPNITCFPGLHPFATAAAVNSIGVMQVISSFFPVCLQNQSDFSLQFCLHVALEGSANASTISYLLEASAAINSPDLRTINNKRTYQETEAGGIV